jgi:hypothetical protein
MLQKKYFCDEFNKAAIPQGFGRLFRPLPELVAISLSFAT